MASIHLAVHLHRIVLLVALYFWKVNLGIFGTFSLINSVSLAELLNIYVFQRIGFEVGIIMKLIMMSLI